MLQTYNTTTEYNYTNISVVTHTTIVYNSRENYRAPIMTTSNEYDKAVERVRRLERAIAHTPSTAIEVDELNRQLADAQRLLKDTIIKDGHSKQTPMPTKDAIMTEVIELVEADDVEMKTQEEKTSKRKSSKKTQKTLSDIFMKKARTESKLSGTSPGHKESKAKLTNNTSTLANHHPLVINDEEFPPLPFATASKLIQKQKQPTSTHKEQRKSSLFKATISPSSTTPSNNVNSSEAPKSSNSNKEATMNAPMQYKKTAMKSIQLNAHTHRINVSVPGFQKQGDSKHNGMHSVITALAFQLHSVDTSARILPWNVEWDTSKPGLAHGTVSHIPPNQTSFYINTKVRTCFIRDRTHYRQGFRITTKLDIEQFMSTWNQTKREIDNMYGVTQAETQFHHRSALVGICSGSSQQKDTTLLLEKLRELTGLPTLDGSWQSIIVGDLTKTLWDEATQRAGDELKAQGRYKINIKSRKFDWAPTGLALYTPTEAEAKKVREILMTKFGKNVSAGVFPQWPDGSRMKFLPLSNMNLSKTSAEKVATRIRFHSYLKAKEHTLDIPAVNPWKIMPGCNISLGQHLHSLVDERGLPIFRHIVKKWTPDPSTKQWAITCYGTKKAMATKQLVMLEEELRKMYGDETASYVTNQRSTNHYVTTEVTSDVENFYNNLTSEEDNEFILEPGYQDLIAQNEMKEMGITDGDSTLNLSEAGIRIDINKGNEVTQETGQSPDSSLESESVGTNTTKSVHFDESVTSGNPLTTEEIIAWTIQKYLITDDRYQELCMQYQVLYDQVTQHHSKASNVVKVFLKTLKSLKIQIRLPEGTRPEKDP